MKLFAVAIALVMAAGPVAAQDESSEFSLGGDQYQAGRSVAQVAPVDGDVFMAGETVDVTSGATGSAHLMGRKVTISGEIGDNIYAAGQDVTLTAPVAGNATMFGQSVSIDGNIGGNLRAMGQVVTLNGDVAGAALLGGETLMLNAQVSGDVSLSGDKISFGDNARINGELSIYQRDPDSLVVPASVISADRISRHVMREDDSWTDQGRAALHPSFWTKAKGFFGMALAVAVVASILGALFPKFVAGAREHALARPVRTGWTGFLGLSAAVGSVVLLALSGIGILLAPVSIFLALLLWFLGYVIGAYILGVGLLSAIGRGLPDDWTDRMVAAVVGAIAASLMALVPFVGWWMLLALTWFGAGAVISRLFRPQFYTRIAD